MKILIISDTHGNMTMVSKILTFAKEYDQIIHLGDDYQDTKPFINAELPIICVPGTWGFEYQNSMIENRRFETFNGWRLFLTHTPTRDFHDLPDDLDPEVVLRNQNCDIFCHGHTHRPEIQEDGKVVVLNPGHLKSDFDRGFPASYATLILTPHSCEIKIIDFFSELVLKTLTIFR